MANSSWIRKALLTASLAVAGAGASALMLDDAKIIVDRAANSPAVHVKYNGTLTALVELRLNGVSIGTREVMPGKSGQTSFALDLSTLRDGDNELEIRLYDKSGKVVGTEKSTISTDQGSRGPVYVLSPKPGEEVSGTIDIKVGFGQNFASKYVSFLINNQFKAMTNVAPFAFTWDTTREANGWHELEVMVVDRDGETYKTRKVKVFVNNAGGQTIRQTTPPVVPPTTPKVNPPAPKVVPNTAAIKAAPTVAANAIPYTLGSTLKTVATSVTALKNNPAEVVAMGARTMTPTTSKVVVSTSGSSARPVQNSKPVNTKINTNLGTTTVNTTAAPAPKAPVTIEKGTRLPNFGTFNIVMAGKPVAFDVSPRVENGIPLTPFRHLFESAGGEVKWDALAKAVEATKDGEQVYLKIGNNMARVNKIDVELEIAPFIERGRTIVPLSFITESLNVVVEYDPNTGHVLIRKK